MTYCDKSIWWAQTNQTIREIRLIRWKNNDEQSESTKLIISSKSDEKMNILFKQESYEIIGAAMEVHNELGSGFMEAVYQEALALEFTKRNIPFKQERRIEISYKNQILSKHYIADFICYNKIIIETKALSELIGNHESQVINYLKATDLKLGLLINFGSESLEYKRLVRY